MSLSNIVAKTIVRPKPPEAIPFQDLPLWESFLDTGQNACIKIGVASYVRVGEAKSWAPPIGSWEVTQINIMETTVRLK